jgi:integrase
MERTSGKHGIADLWYFADGAPTKLGEPDSSPKRPRGQGSRWRAWYIDADGKERTKRFATKQPAENWLSAQTADLTKGTWIAPERSGETFGTIAAEWLAAKKTSRTPKTAAGYESLLETVVLPKWRNVPLKDLKHGDLQQFVTGLSTTGGTRKGGTGLSASRVRQAHQVIFGVLRYAIRTDRLVKNVAQDIDLPAKQSAARRYLTHKQLQQLAAKTDRFEALTLVLGYCGLRIGEAIALRRRDVGNRTITVRVSITSVTGQGQVEGDTKTHRSREVPVPAFVWERFKPTLPSDPDALVFPSRKGGHLTIGEYRWVFDTAASDIKLSGLVPHELRHTCASLAISAGANVKAVQTLLGHASAVMTLDLYGHLLSDDLTRVARDLDKAARRAAA